MDKVSPTKNQVIPGTRYGKLTIVQRVHDKNTKTANLKVQVRVQCDCGNRLTIPFWYLVRPHSPPKTSCGQCAPISLQVIFKDLYQVWYSMNYRTHPEGAPQKFHEVYYGRGIRICQRWDWDRPSQLGFIRFIEDTYPRPPQQSIDRIDNNGHYTPYNTRWATAQQQRENQGHSQVFPIDEPPLDGPAPNCQYTSLDEILRKIGIAPTKIKAPARQG